MLSSVSESNIIPTVSLLSDQEAIERIFTHIDDGTTDLGDTVWREPVENYHSQERFDAEIALLRSLPIPFCPSAALSEKGSYIARKSAGTPLVVVRGRDGKVRAFINACRHRGMQVASGSGRAHAFVCPYHAWSYGLDGSLKSIPGEEAFPGLAIKDHGLVEVSAMEKGGLVYVMQKGTINPEMLENSRTYFSPEQQLFRQSENTDQANWKLLTETLLEGYHIKSLHQKSFYPYGLDNVNLVETYGANARVTFPFRRIEKLRDVPAEKRRAAGMLTSVYHLFPNASVSVLSKHSNLTIMEPLSPSSTQMVIYLITPEQTIENPISLEDVERDAEFVNQSGQDEDREAACLIQQTVTAQANSHLTFGYFEKAIVNFHQHLTETLDL
ncbi:Rieske 2Fe-2S domain-containing protein [Porticoccaceae bacterium]|jgi:phenylpropionate dioxygenase-like ring-hydroxylating dioxygenase large terminal subunit|nr:Rieske 2Fe-2S domain-containing protein [Porticoccaceae bacterium]